MFSIVNGGNSAHCMEHQFVETSTLVFVYSTVASAGMRSREIASMRYPSSVLKVVLCGLDCAGMRGHQQNVQGYKRVISGM